MNEVRDTTAVHPVVSKGRLHSVVAKAKWNQDSRAFAARLRSDPILRDLFSLHWSQLSLFEEASFPIIVSLTAKGAESKASIEKEARRGEERGSFTLEKIVEDSKPRLMDRLEHFAKTLGAPSADMESLDPAQVSFQLMKAMGLFTTGSPIRGLVTFLKPYEDYFGDELALIVISLLSATKSRVLSVGAVRRLKTIEGAEVSEGDYEKTIEGLREDGYLLPLLTLAWCEAHKDLPTSLYIVGHSAIPDLRCHVCQKTLNHMTFYTLAPSAMTLVRQYDGFLPYLFALDLEEKGVLWNGDCYLEGEADDLEKDLLYVSPKGGYGVIECKTWVTDVPERTMKSNLKSALGQLTDQVGALRAKGIQVRRAILAVNYKLSSDLREFVSTLLSEPSHAALKEVEFSLYGRHDVWSSPK